MPWRSSASFVVGAVGLSAAALLFAAEIVCRIVDGYALTPRLVLVRPKPPNRSSSAPRKWLVPPDAEYYASRLPVVEGIDPAWFQIDPVSRPKAPIDSEMQRRFYAHPGFELSSVYEWNAEYVRRTLCNPAGPQDLVFSRVDDLFLYEPPDRQPSPVFRFLRQVHYPSGLQTNAFGWRGPDVSLNKPARTVRLAFVGDSTTIDPHGDPVSYPEYVGAWLNEWARARKSGVTFEVINAGREGVDVAAVSAIVEQELAPVRPDIVVDYSVNEFWPDGFIAEKLPGRSRLLQVSALALRWHNAWQRLDEGHEPPKPPLRVSWPADLSEQDPPLDDPRLPVHLPVTLRAMDRMQAAVSGYGGTLMPSSFVWLVSPGLVLDRERDAGVYRFLNETLWPFSYAHIRRYVDFQNRTFRKYAMVHGLPFNDLAALFPADPRLFLDAVHMTQAGIKLKAWLVFQQLVPELQRRLADGRLPLADPGGRTRHPAIGGTPRLVRLDEIRRACGAPSRN
jgi:hypothetical protein